MIRVVLDSNVLASGFVRPASIPGELLRQWAAGAFELIASEPMVEEVRRTLEKDYFRARLTPEQRAGDIKLLQDEATFTQITAQVHGVATHPEDDLVLAAAVSAGADYLVTGDGPFRRRVGTYQAVTLVSPREFLELHIIS